MMIQHSLFYAVVFFAVMLIVFIAITQFLPTPVDERVRSLTADQSPIDTPAPESRVVQALSRWLAPLAAFSLPSEGWAKSPLRIRFYSAGFRSATAPVVYLGAKTLLTFALPGIVLALAWTMSANFRSTQMMAVLLGLAALGYYLPNAALSHMIARRQRELFEAFPDALDLMRVCVESGLGMDAAMARVGREMAVESPALCDEFHLASLELRAGASRAETLRNLALRVGLEDIDAMVSMLVQADRFGTSVAESLRTHSVALRTKRRLIAEEAAAKLPVKMLVPLVFCVFPALLAVVLGPAMISVYRILIPRMAGQ